MAGKKSEIYFSVYFKLRDVDRLDFISRVMLKNDFKHPRWTPGHNRAMISRGKIWRRTRRWRRSTQRGVKSTLFSSYARVIFPRVMFLPDSKCVWEGSTEKNKNPKPPRVYTCMCVLSETFLWTEVTFRVLLLMPPFWEIHFYLDALHAFRSLSSRATTARYCSTAHGEYSENYACRWICKINYACYSLREYLCKRVIPCKCNFVATLQRSH